LTERTLHTRLVYGEPHAQRMVSYEYLNRQLVWRELSELALFVLPLVSGPSLRRAASRAFGMAGNRGGDEGGGCRGCRWGCRGGCRRTAVRGVRG
jgi:peroxin-2